MSNPGNGSVIATAPEAAKSPVTVVVGAAPAGLANLATAFDMRSGGATIVDGAGNVHRLQILQEMHGGNPGLQDVFYAVTKATDPYTAINFLSLGIANKVLKNKVYSIDGAAIQSVNGQTTIVFMVEVSNAAAGQSKLLCYLQGANVVPLR